MALVFLPTEIFIPPANAANLLAGVRPGLVLGAQNDYHGIVFQVAEELIRALK